MSGPNQAHLYVTQINSSRSHFRGTIELIMCLEFLKTDLKLNFEVGSLKYWKLRILK